MKTKKIIFYCIIIFFLLSCEQPEELPPVNEGYNTEYVMPEGTFLTDEDRAIIEDQEKEYEENAKK